MRMLFVRDVMTQSLVTLAEGDRLSLADQIMQLARIRHLPVIDGEQRLVGLVTHRDLLAAATSSVQDLCENADWRHKQGVEVSSIMRRNVLTVSPGTSIVEAAKLMRSHMYGCLPVVAARCLVGLVTEADLVEALVRMLEERGD